MPPAPTPPRDIALIVLDDIPRSMLTAYGASHGLAPHIDALSDSAVKFEAAFTTSPLCTPARWALLTGRYAANATSIVSHRPWNSVGFNTFLTGQEDTLAHALRRAGYRTCLCGKYHLGFPLPAELRTGRSTFGGGGRGIDYDAIVGAVRKFGGFDAAPAVYGGNKQTAVHHPEWMAAEAVSFLRATHAARQRAFVYFAPTLPHAPFVLPDSLTASANITPAGVPAGADVISWQRARQELLSRLNAAGYVCGASPSRCAGDSSRASHPRSCAAAKEAALLRAISLNEPWLDRSWLLAADNCEQRRLSSLFVAGLAWLDGSVGALVSALHRNSLVVLTADHGASWLGKGSPYEAGITVPLMIRWPGVVLGGRSVQTVATHLDIRPTLLEAAGNSDGSDVAHGRSLLRTLLAMQPDRANVEGSAGKEGGVGGDGDGREGDSEGQGGAARPIFVELGYARAVRFGRWKLVVVNDPTMRCAPDSRHSHAVCRNFHGQKIDRRPPTAAAATSSSSAAAAAAAHNGSTRPSMRTDLVGVTRRFGLGNMTYDAAARHAAFCDRRQLYDLVADPLEQTNLAAQQLEVYAQLLELLISHVRRVEAGNPAIARQRQHAARAADGVSDGVGRDALPLEMGCAA